MLCLATNACGVRSVPRDTFESGIWTALWDAARHSSWVGMTAWDLVQPAFIFMVGLALPYSLAARTARGDSRSNQVWHAFRRALVLVLLGVFLASNGSARTEFVFDNVLAQIGLAYPVVFAALLLPWRWQVVLVATVLLATFGAFAAYPVPVDGAAEAPLEGFFAHWNPHSNAAAAFDRVFLNLFPRAEPLAETEGGYQTLSFVPSIANMFAGVWVAAWLRQARASGVPAARGLVVAGLVVVALGVAVSFACPVVKRVWTPSFALLSSGVTVLVFAVFYWLIDVRGVDVLASAFVDMGVNSLAVYLLIELARPWIEASVFTHVAWWFMPVRILPAVASCVAGAALWGLARWMRKNKVFLRI
ncbi:MAG: DUF5009 domain-containing protein [Myxococcales bacterium]|nr:DUF5009 domain-containing protein [Myxococcales bacterium]